MRATTVHDLDSLALGFLDLLGIGRDLLRRLERDDRDVEHARAACRPGHIECGGHRASCIVIGRCTHHDRLGRSGSRRRRSQRRARRVESDVATTDHHDAFTELDAEALIHVEEVLDGT